MSSIVPCMCDLGVKPGSVTPCFVPRGSCEIAQWGSFVTEHCLAAERARVGPLCDAAPERDVALISRAWPFVSFFGI